MYAVLQTDLTPPSLEQLQRAFRTVPGLTATDAHILGQDAFGVLVKNFPEDRAVALQLALRREGIETELVRQSYLPALPPQKQVTRLDCLPDHLLLYDPLGRSFALPWVHVMLVGAGYVRMNEFVQERTDRVVTRYNGQGGAYSDTEPQYFSREQRTFRLMGDLLVAGGTLRYGFTANRFNFVYLGERRTRDDAQNFLLLLNDLARYSTQARWTRGATLLRSEQVIAYPTKNAYFEEMVWTLWQMKKGL